MWATDGMFNVHTPCSNVSDYLKNKNITLLLLLLQPPPTPPMRPPLLNVMMMMITLITTQHHKPNNRFVFLIWTSCFFCLIHFPFCAFRNQFWRSNFLCLSVCLIYSYFYWDRFRIFPFAVKIMTGYKRRANGTLYENPRKCTVCGNGFPLWIQQDAFFVRYELRPKTIWASYR